MKQLTRARSISDLARFLVATQGRLSWPAPLLWLLLVTICHGSLYAFLFPPWQGLDEPTHYAYLRAVAAVDTLVPVSLVRDAAIEREVVESFTRYRFWAYNKLPTPTELPTEPPFSKFPQRAASLYYRLSLPVYWTVREWPVESQLYVLRLFSVGLQVLTVWATYQLAALIFLTGGAEDTARQLWPAAAAAVVALFPMYAFVGMSYNDDNLMSPLVTLSLYALLRGLKQGGHLGWWGLAVLGAVLALLTKRTGISLVLLVGFSLSLYASLWLKTAQQTLQVAGGAVLAISLLAAVLVAGSIFFPFTLPATVANWFQLTPDALQMLSANILKPTQFARVDWASELTFLSVSFWGWFGYLKIPFSFPLMELLRHVTLLGVIGLGISLALKNRAVATSNFQISALLIMSLGLLISIAVLVAQFLVGPPAYLLVGRYLFPFIAAFAILILWGWLIWWPERWRLQGLMAALVGLVWVDFTAVLALIIPYYYS
jgi:hypothetical protein